ncbi:MAG: PilZ domain [Candidatus Brocadiaceae bacterium]|nr:PilZ domain [Candidatus Brocadiaceae bacterium]
MTIINKEGERRCAVRKRFMQRVKICLSADNLKEGEPTDYDGCVIDISKYGVCVSCKHLLEKGVIVQILIRIAAYTTIPVFAEVMWVKSFNLYKIGLRFLGS